MPFHKRLRPALPGLQLPHGQVLCAQAGAHLCSGGECVRGGRVQVRPLRKQLRTLDAWITGQRKDQSPGTRAAVPVVQVDPAFEGLSGGPGSLVKFNPLANVKGNDLWGFLRLLNVPVNELHSKVGASLLPANAACTDSQPSPS